MSNKETQFQPGQSGNLNGAPKKANSMRAILERIGEELHKLEDGEISKKELLAKMIFTEALKGNIHYVKMALERMEGMPKQTIETEEKNVNVYLADEALKNA